MSRKVRIIYTKASFRPDFYTTEDNIPTQEKLYGNIIQDIQIIHEDLKIERIKPTDRTIAPLITEEALVKELKRRGKVAKAIAVYLKIDLATVEKYLSTKEIGIVTTF